MHTRPERSYSLTRIPVVSWGNHPDTYLLPGDDFAAIERRWGDRVASDEQALFVMARAASACSSPLDPGWREKASTETIRRHSAWKETFCHGRVTADEFMGYSTMMQRARQERQADDMWAEEMRPDEIAIIARIQQRILDERARRAGAPAGAP
jgi:hypothetical protein